MCNNRRRVRIHLQLVHYVKSIFIDPPSCYTKTCNHSKVLLLNKYNNYMSPKLKRAKLDIEDISSAIVAKSSC